MCSYLKVFFSKRTEPAKHGTALAHVETQVTIIGDQLHPDMLLYIGNTMHYVIELTVRFETKLISNAERKREEYYQLTGDLENLL